MLASERPIGPILIVLAGLAFLSYFGVTLASGDVPVKLLSIVLVIPVAVAIVFKPLIGLVLLLCSYAYCLPVGYGSFAGVLSEWRVYDLAFVAVLACLAIRSFVGQPFHVADSAVNKPLRNFFVVCVAGTVISAFTVGLDRMPIIMIRLFRLFAYSGAFVLVTSLLRTRRQLRLLIDVFIFTGLAVGLISTLQEFGLIPHLWSARYQQYGHENVATLAPHHKHIAVYTLLALAMLIGRAKTIERSLLRALLYSSSFFLVFPSFAAKSRTGLLGFGVYFLSSLALAKKRTGILVAIGVGAVGFFLLFGSDPFEVSADLLDKQLVKMTTAEGGLDPTQLSTSRMRIYEHAVGWITEYPAMLIWGTGFQSSGMSSLLPGSPHNNYLLVWFELGILGLFTYLALLRSIWRQGYAIMSSSASDKGKIIAREYIAVFVANLVTLMVGEHLYPQRAMFSFLGTFLFVTALALHPLWLQDERCAGGNSHRLGGYQKRLTRGSNA